MCLLLSRQLQRRFQMVKAALHEPRQRTSKWSKEKKTNWDNGQAGALDHFLQCAVQKKTHRVGREEVAQVKKVSRGRGPTVAAASDHGQSRGTTTIESVATTWRRISLIPCDMGRIRAYITTTFRWLHEVSYGLPEPRKPEYAGPNGRHCDDMKIRPRCAVSFRLQFRSLKILFCRLNYYLDSDCVIVQWLFLFK